jgi:polyprenyl-phospho-N-acetylgalactosaminyl synthase
MEAVPSSGTGGLAGVFAAIPAYNEGGAIGRVIEGLVARGVRVVVVDDGSADDTGARALAAGAEVLTHEVNRGQGAALQTAISYALLRGAEIVVTFDADGQHDPEDLERLVAPIRRGEAEIALGSRFLGACDGVPRSRRFVLRAAVLFTRMTSGVRLTDAHNGLRAFSRKAASRIDLQLDRMAHASEIIDQIRRSGLAYVEVPVTIRYTEYSRRKGQSSIAAARIALDYLLGKVLR